MSPEKIREFITAVPFRPFVLNVADGRTIPVIGRDFILVQPESGHVVIVFQKNGDFAMLDNRYITGLSFDGASDPSVAS
jgi:hypothetical protein